jgi:hypothetical protein
LIAVIGAEMPSVAGATDVSSPSAGVPVTLNANDAAALSESNTVESGLERIRAAQAADIALRDTPAAVAEREASATSYRGLSDASALATIRDAFPRLLTEPLWQPPALGPGESIIDWKDDLTASVALSDGSEATLHSATPIRSSVGSSSEKLVDIGLAPDGAGYYPANPLTPYRLSADLNSAFTFEEAGVSVRFADAEATSARAADGKLSYPNAWTDTDLVVSPLPEGFSTTQVLRSEDSPEAFKVALDLPVGAALEQQRQIARHDAAIVRLGGGDSFGITPPMAWDADGIPVRTSLSVTGSDSLVIGIEHREADVHYPLQLDPSYVFCTGGCNYWTDWTYYNPDGNRFALAETCYYSLPSGCYGLWIVPHAAYAHPDWYGYGDQAFWYWAGGYWRNERIYRYVAGGSSGNGLTGAVIHGLYDPATLRYVPGNSQVRGEFPPTEEDDTSPWVAEPQNLFYHYNYQVDQCFVGLSPDYNGANNNCQPTEAAHYHPDLAPRTPVFDFAVYDRTTVQQQAVGGFMRYAYAFTISADTGNGVVGASSCTPAGGVPDPDAVDGPRLGAADDAYETAADARDPIDYEIEKAQCSANMRDAGNGLIEVEYWRDVTLPQSKYSNQKNGKKLANHMISFRGPPPDNNVADAKTRVYIHARDGTGFKAGIVNGGSQAFWAPTNGAYVHGHAVCKNRLESFRFKADCEYSRPKP